MDSLLGTIVLLLIMAVSSWLQKKAQQRQIDSAGEDGESSHPQNAPPPVSRPDAPGQPSPRPVRGIDWQQELRRLLEGEASPPPPKPVVVKETLLPAMPPQVHPPTMVKPPRPAPVASISEEGRESSRVAPAIAAYRQAQQLHSEASARLHQAVEQAKRRESMSSRRAHGKGSPEIASAISLVRSRSSVRQAFVASVVLGPPTALEN
ncbi:MAG: hypothetical protein HY735_09095 [Verrucomicrobia bacterium]|nr:hypothetical protein [Verrucomicrobiota bacterium]